MPFLARKVLLMNKKQLVMTGVILTLFVSNVALGEKYIIDKQHYKDKIHSQSFEIRKKEFQKDDLKDVIKVKSSENKILLNEIKKSSQQINNLKKENATLKMDNIKLKKEFKKRKEANKHRQLNMELTFYGADCGGCSGITKTGIDVSNTVYYQGMRIVASDPRVIPLHSIIKIKTKKESYTAYVADTGGAIKGNILDVLVSSERESFQHGRQQAVVTIIKEVK